MLQPGVPIEVGVGLGVAVAVSLWVAVGEALNVGVELADGQAGQGVLVADGVAVLVNDCVGVRVGVATVPTQATKRIR